MIATLQLDAELGRAFSFLISDFEFRCVSISSEAIRFESDKVTIDLVLDLRNTPELSLLISFRSQFDGVPFGAFHLAEILRCSDSTGVHSFESSAVTTTDALAASIARMAEQLRIHGSDFLRGHKSRFLELQQARQRETWQGNVSFQLRIARVRSEKAWRAKDYRIVTRLLKRFERELSQDEKSRLRYARKQNG